MKRFLKTTALFLAVLMLMSIVSLPYEFSGETLITASAATQTLVSSRVTLSASSYVYNGSVKNPTVTVKNAAGTVLKKDVDYTVTYSDGCKYPGTYSAVVIGKGSYTGVIVKNFTITKQTLSASRITLSPTSYTYTGAVKKPTVTVKSSQGTTLKEGTSYTLTYCCAGGCKKVGTHTITVAAADSSTCFKGSVKKTFTITSAKKALPTDNITLSPATFTYNNSVKTTKVTVKTDAGTALTEGTSFKVTYCCAGGCKTVGTHKVTITGMGNFTGSTTKTFTITKQALAASRITLSTTSFKYDGTVKKPTVTVKSSHGSTLKEGVSYTLSYCCAGGCKKAGTHTVTVTAMGKCFSGTQKKTFVIESTLKQLDADNITMTSSYTFNNSAMKPEPVVKSATGVKLTKGKSYTVTYCCAGGCKKVGTHKVTIKGMGTYTGTVEKTFTINKQKLTDSLVSLNQNSFTYDGKAHKPTVSVKTIQGSKLTEGTSFTVTYPAGCTAVGTYTITITGKGNYTGTVKKTFTIKASTKKVLLDENVTLSATAFTYNNTVMKPTVVAKSATGAKLTNGVSYTVSYCCAGGCTKVGTHTVKVIGMGTYTGTVEKTFTIKQQALTSARVTLSATSFTYDGNVHKPTVTVKSASGKTLTEGTSYTVTYSTGCKEAGTYTVKITGKGSFTGTITKSFVINGGYDYSISYDIYNGDTYLKKVSISNPNPDGGYSSSKLTLKNLKADGYQFLGWYDSAVGGTRYSSIPAGNEDDIELYAQWKVIEYEISFESDLVPVDSITYTVKAKKVLPTPKLDGYLFVGWSDENGDIIKTIPVGTTGDKVYSANWLSERNKAWTKKTLDDPIIIEDDETDTILFTYEIGRVENVPIYTIEDFGYINSEGVTKTVTKEYSVKTEKSLMEQYSKNISHSTTDSSQWSLSDGWSDSVSENKSYLEENLLSETDAQTICKTDSNNWLISSGSSGSTTTTTYDSKQEYDLTTETDNTKTYDTSEGSSEVTHKQSAELDLATEAEVHAGGKIEGIVDVGGSVKESMELDIGYEGSHTNSNTDKTGTESDDGSSEQTGNIKHTGTDTVSSGGWNKSSSYGGSKSVSESDTISKTISEKIASEYGYGKTYVKNGSETNSIGKAVSSSDSSSYSSSVTYSTEESEKTTITYTTTNTKTGYHRYIVAGTAHVFAVVGYDIKTASYFVYTFSVMDDETHNFEDYSYSSAQYDDNQSGVISFEVPYEVEEYVLEKTGETAGLEFNSKGVVTGYSGTEELVVIPEYHAIDNRDGTKTVLKVTGISADAFRNNTNITGVVLSDYIETIPDNAFENCTSLSLVEMSGVTSIGKEAFKNCPAIDYIFLSEKVTSLGDNAFSGMDTFIVYTASVDVIEEALKSGAKNIGIYVSDKCSSLANKELTTAAGTELFVFNGRGKTFDNLRIVSSAGKTVINNITLNSTGKAPLQISSSEAELGKVKVNASGTALILSANECNLGLYGESELSSTSGNTMLCKNVTLSKTDDAVTAGTFSELKVNGDVLVCGNISGASYLNCSGTIKSISESEYNKYLIGTFKISFDGNGGTASSSAINAYCGAAVGTLPTASRTGFDFDGWYTAASGGNKITADSIFSDAVDVTLYAHWNAKAYSVNWSNGTGYSINVNRTSSPYAGASTGALSSGSTVYYGDTLNVTYSAATYYTLSNHGSTNITVTGDIGSETIYAGATENGWSEWTTDSSKSGNSAYATETKTQYQYSDRRYTTSTNSSMDGWERYDSNTSYGSWGGWSDWTTSAIGSSDTRDVGTKTQYRFHYYSCNKCGVRWYGYCKHSALGSSCSGTISSYHEVWSDHDYNTGSMRKRTSDGRIWSFDEGGGDYFYDTAGKFGNQGTRTLYRYRDRSKTVTYYYRCWSSWSGWQDSYVSAGSDRQVNTRTVYRYKLK